MQVTIKATRDVGLRIAGETRQLKAGKTMPADLSAEDVAHLRAQAGVEVSVAGQSTRALKTGASKLVPKDGEDDKAKGKTTKGGE